ncbi:hypothetical protein CJ196_06860 [Bifidobacterium breve]|nr:hypothetical protein CYJ38_07190 [Bifidobacterium breve]PMC73001.1 hypothetical protein CJ196_06860 [Bifidobacterium breve]
MNINDYHRSIRQARHAMALCGKRTNFWSSQEQHAGFEHGESNVRQWREQWVFRLFSPICAFLTCKPNAHKPMVESHKY